MTAITQTPTTRLYQSPDDLGAIGQLIRQVHQQDPGLNSWSFALFDIWSYRKLGVEAVFKQTEWQEDIRLWENKSNTLVAAAAFRDPHFAKMVFTPDYTHLAEPMLDWLETRFAAKQLNDTPLVIETIASHPALESLLSQRGFRRSSGYYIYREKNLHPYTLDPVVLPSGFTLKAIETPVELDRFHTAVHQIFNFQDSAPVYQILRQASSFRPELDLIIMTENGTAAAVASTWFEPNLRLAEYEPVGTVSEYRQLGLGKALIAESCNRLRRLGCQTISVMSWNESIPANRLYEGAGMVPRNEKRYWEKMTAV